MLVTKTSSYRFVLPAMLNVPYLYLFIRCYFVGGARFQAYTCICASGDNGAVLHYGHAGEPNGKMIASEEMCLFDMGCEYHCYTSDVTCSFPSDGVFSDKMKLVYETVLAAQWGVMDNMKPGVSWVDMHALAYRIILTKLKEGGLLVGDVDAMLSADLGAVFMPHGLGHFMGLDTHDVGGYTLDSPLRSVRPGFKSLRTSRILEENMVWCYMTVSKHSLKPSYVGMYRLLLLSRVCIFQIILSTKL